MTTFEKALTARPEFSGVSGHMVGETGANAANGLGDVGAAMPPLPRNVSPDGREIWDWAAKLSEARQRVQKIRELRSEIARRPRECGSCQKWMTHSCPKEHNVGGRPRGPSMKAPICGQHILKDYDAKRLDELRAELAALEQSS